MPLGIEVILHGYLGNRVDVSKNLTFVDLVSKDLNVAIQVVSFCRNSDGDARSPHHQLKAIPKHSPIAVRGFTKAKRPSLKDSERSHVRPYSRKDDVELELQELFCLNRFPNDIMMSDDTVHPPEDRHLQLRSSPILREALARRSRIVQLARAVLIDNGFVEIETPLLFKSTPEGAREFLVPTRDKGLAYALPQSPQQYKQILMASGMPKYFQIARCFRDEDLRTDRQPEFTQLDLEMSFATGERVMAQIEALLLHLFHGEPILAHGETYFPRFTYDEVMASYGSDKPDLRIGMKMQQIENLLPADLISKVTPHVYPVVDIFNLHVSDNPRETRQFINSFLDSSDGSPFLANPDGQPGIFIYDPSQPLDGLGAFGFQTAEYVEDTLAPDPADLIVLQARPKKPFTGGSTAAGRLRLALHKSAVAQGLIPPPQGFQFLWVTDFPLFTPDNDTDPGQGGTAGFSSTHHPFTAPKSVGDIELLRTDPLKAKAEHYDIVLNGVELGGGSRRIHNAEFQLYILKDVLKMPPERLQHFEHLLHVLEAGCPPHAGIALGLDRLVAVMLGRDSIRDVIAFPKSGRGEDLLVKSPSPFTAEQLDTYHLQLRD